MKNVLRISLTLAAIAAAVASQALTLDYVGSGDNALVNGSFKTTSLGYLGDDFNFATSVTTPATSTIVLADALGTSGLTLTYTATSVSGTRFSGTATATGFGAYAGYTASALDIVRNRTTGAKYVISIQGDVQAVPEPASMAALGLGAAAMIRRRRNKNA